MCRASQPSHLFFAFWMLAIPFSPIQAQDETTPWLDDQSVAIIRFNVKDVETFSSLRKLIETMPKAANELNLGYDQLRAISQSIIAAGGEELLVVYSFADDLSDQPLWIVPKAKRLDLQPISNSFFAYGALNPMRKKIVVKSHELGGATVVGSAVAVERVKMNQSKAGQELRDFLIQPAGTVSALVTLNSDQRRALAEIQPALPDVLGGGATRTLLDAIKWLRIDLQAGNATSIKFTIAGNEATIVSQKNLLSESKAISKLPPLQFTLTKYLLEEVFSKPPVIHNKQLSWQFSVDEAMRAGLSDLLSAALMQADQISLGRQLRDLALAIHNHHSALKRFPSPLIGLNGKARQLSWRVDLLPFLNEDALYREFRLDEPWDSEHNKRLIPRMPAVFRCPQSKHVSASGLSTFALPGHAETMWPLDRALDFKDITDGSSNTVMIVEVKDELAQVWTKPDPFLVDLKEPTDRLGGHFTDRIYFARADGSFAFVPKTKYDQLPALLTRAGGEVVK